MQAFLQHQSPSIRAMAIQALRYTLPDSDEAFDTILKATLIDMLIVMLNDEDLENRRLALTTLNAASHNKPDLIIPNLNQLLPLVMRESVINTALIREVMMGPFKHKVDDGLEVRKVCSSDLTNIETWLTIHRALTKPCTLSWRRPSRVSISWTSTTVWLRV